MTEKLFPGRKAKHAIITDVCRMNRGTKEAFDEASRLCYEEYEELLKVWPSGTTQYHLILTVEPSE